MKYGIQSSNINFLFGSGLSVPFLKTLGEVEQRLTELERHDPISRTAKTIVLASIRKAYFDLCIGANCEIINSDPACGRVLESYKGWFSSLNQLLINRKNTLLNKQVNLFTTNMDVFSEVALEAIGVEYNDGFYGTISPVFGLSNFKKSVLKTSQQYSVAAEMPMFNLYKLHGSVTWKMLSDDLIGFDHNLKMIEEIKSMHGSLNQLIDVFVPGSKKIKPLSDLCALCSGNKPTKQAEAFNKAYEKLVMVNPTKDKFRLTTLNRTYYELLRMYANELERENSILFVMGFSFADEHLAEITLRAARSNPTLKIYIYAYDDQAELAIKSSLNLSNPKGKIHNIVFVPRTEIKDSDGNVSGEVPHTLENINQNGFSILAEETNGRK